MKDKRAGTRLSNAKAPDDAGASHTEYAFFDALPSRLLEQPSFRRSPVCRQKRIGQLPTVAPAQLILAQKEPHTGLRQGLPLAPTTKCEYRILFLTSAPHRAPSFVELSLGFRIKL